MKRDGRRRMHVERDSRSPNNELRAAEKPISGGSPFSAAMLAALPPSERVGYERGFWNGQAVIHAHILQWLKETTETALSMNADPVHVQILAALYAGLNGIPYYHADGTHGATEPPESARDLTPVRIGIVLPERKYDA